LRSRNKSKECNRNGGGAVQEKYEKVMEKEGRRGLSIQETRGLKSNNYNIL
jgi:hypothetical protein